MTSVITQNNDQRLRWQAMVGIVCVSEKTKKKKKHRRILRGYTNICYCEQFWNAWKNVEGGKVFIFHQTRFNYEI